MVDDWQKKSNRFVTGRFKGITVYLHVNINPIWRNIMNRNGTNIDPNPRMISITLVENPSSMHPAKIQNEAGIITRKAGVQC